MGRPPKLVDFFRVWTPEMAYVLGRWWTDGMMRIKRNTGAHEIDIACNDVSHLEEIARVVGHTYHIRKVDEDSNCYRINFCSKEMYQDILKHGGTPRKSLTIGFAYVPPEFLPHFVRAIVDGDGTLSWNGDRPVLHIYSGSRQFLFDLAAAIENATGIPAPNIAANRTIFYLKWSTIRAKCLAGWLYDMNAGIELAYKAEIAKLFLEWCPKKKPEKGTITEAMCWNFPNYLSL